MGPPSGSRRADACAAHPGNLSLTGANLFAPSNDLKQLSRIKVCVRVRPHVPGYDDRLHCNSDAEKETAVAQHVTAETEVTPMPLRPSAPRLLKGAAPMADSPMPLFHQKLPCQESEWSRVPSTMSVSSTSSFTPRHMNIVYLPPLLPTSDEESCGTLSEGLQSLQPNALTMAVPDVKLPVVGGARVEEQASKTDAQEPVKFPTGTPDASFLSTTSPASASISISTSSPFQPLRLFQQKKSGRASFFKRVVTKASVKGGVGQRRQKQRQDKRQRAPRSSYAFALENKFLELSKAKSELLGNGVQPRAVLIGTGHSRSLAWNTNPDGRVALQCTTEDMSKFHISSQGLNLRSYHFDTASGPTARTESLYTKSISPMLSSVVNDGCNGIVLAYGPQGGGRTHCLIGTESDPGIAALAILDLFRLFGEATKRMVGAAGQETTGQSQARRTNDNTRGQQPQQAHETRSVHSLRLSCLRVDAENKGSGGAVSDCLAAADATVLGDRVNFVEGTDLIPMPSRSPAGTAEGRKNLAVVVHCAPTEVECADSASAFKALAKVTTKYNERCCQADTKTGMADAKENEENSDSHVIIRFIVEHRMEFAATGTVVARRTSVLTLVDPVGTDTTAGDSNNGPSALEAILKASVSPRKDGPEGDGETAPVMSGRSCNLAKLIPPRSVRSSHVCVVCAIPPPPLPQASAIAHSSPASPLSSPRGDGSSATAGLELPPSVEAGLRALTFASRTLSGVRLRPRINSTVPVASSPAVPSPARSPPTAAEAARRDPPPTLAAAEAPPPPPLESATAGKTPASRNLKKTAGGDPALYLTQIDALRRRLAEAEADARALRLRASEELRRNRSELAWLRRELWNRSGDAAAGNGDGRDLASLEQPSVSSEHEDEVLQELGRSVAADKRRQRLRDTAKYVDNAISRIAGAHHLDLTVLKQKMTADRDGFSLVEVPGRSCEENPIFAECRTASATASVGEDTGSFFTALQGSAGAWEETKRSSQQRAGRKTPPPPSLKENIDPAQTRAIGSFVKTYMYQRNGANDLCDSLLLGDTLHSAHPSAGGPVNSDEEEEGAKENPPDPRCPEKLNGRRTVRKVDDEHDDSTCEGDEDALSIESDAVSSLTRSTMFGHCDHGRDSAAVVGELWRIRSILRLAMATGHEENVV